MSVQLISEHTEWAHFHFGPDTFEQPDINASNTSEAVRWAQLKLDIGATAFELASLLDLDESVRMELVKASVEQASNLEWSDARGLHDSLCNMAISLLNLANTDSDTTDTGVLSEASPSTLHAEVVYLNHYRDHCGHRSPLRCSGNTAKITDSPNYRESASGSMYVAPQNKLSNIELFEAMIPAKTTEERVTALAELALVIDRQVKDPNRFKDENVARGIVLLYRSRLALLENKTLEPEDQLSRLVNDIVGTFIKVNSGYIHKIIEPFAPGNSSLELKDLMSVGNLGLLQGLGRFDLGQVKAKVLTFCSSRIRGAVIDELRSQGYLIRASRADVRQMHHVQDELDQGATIQEIADTLGTTEEEVHALLDRFYKSRTMSIDEMADSRYTGGTITTIADTLGSSPDETHNAATFTSEVDVILSQLPAREQLVVRMHYGYPPYTGGFMLKEIGAKLGVGESRVCQILTEAKQVIKKALSVRIDQGSDRDEVLI